MTLHVDIPSREELERLLRVRRAGCVSIYLPTSTITRETEADQIVLGNLAAEAASQLVDAGAAGDARELSEQLDDLAADDAFWTRQANSLAVFATAEGVLTFRLPNRLTETVQVSDRFHVKPLLRAVTFPQAAFVLALSQNAVRLLEVAPEAAPAQLTVPGIPSDAASAVGKASLGDRAPDRRIQGSEGRKVRLRQYARQIEDALRPILSGAELPLILAATEPLDAIFRSVCGYPHLADATIPGNPDESSDAELAAASRGVLDDLYARELAELRELYATRAAAGRAADDLQRIARAATYGAVDTAFVDIDEPLPGVVDEDTGAVTLAQAGDASSYGVLDEIARRVVLARGRLLAVRRDDVPGPGPAAAILRYAI